MLVSNDTGDKRLRIMQAAAQVFAQKGFHRAKMEEIARAADVGKGTVYEYFSSKEQLFIEMFRAGNEYCNNLWAGQLKNESGIYNKLKKAAYLHLSFFDEHRDLAKVMMQEFLQLGPELHQEFLKVHEKGIALLNDIFSQGVRKGYFICTEINVAARMFYGAVQAIGVPMIIWEEKYNLDQLSEKIVDIFLYGIVNRSSDFQKINGILSMSKLKD
ncbi:MAG: TetR/AcrR family transcriptional regulator [Dehalobacterium sp.]